MQDGAARPRIILDVKLLMQTQRILVRRRLERALTLVIALALVFAGLCIYVYLVEVYESHWVSNCPFLPVCTWRGFSSSWFTSHFVTRTQGTPRPTSESSAGSKLARQVCLPR